MATKAKGKPQTSAKKTPPTYTCAMDKLRDEMAKSKQRYVQIVGEYLTDYLQQHPEAEDKLMAAGKSIAGSLDAMTVEARKAQQGNVGILDDATAFGVVLRYYGIEGEEGNREQGTGNRNSREAAPVIPSEAPVIPSEVPVIPSEVVAEGLAQRQGSSSSPSPAPDPFDLDALMGGL